MGKGLFGRSLEELGKQDVEVEKMQLKEGETHKYQDSLEGFVPLFFRKMVTTLLRGLHTQNLFKNTIPIPKIQNLKVTLRTSGNEIDWSDFILVSNVLLHWLADLPEPLVPKAHFESFRELDNSEISVKLKTLKIKTLLKQIGLTQRFCLQMLFKLLSLISQMEHINQLRSTNLGVIFSSVILYNDKPFWDGSLFQLVQIMIDNYEIIFFVTLPELFLKKMESSK